MNSVASQGLLCLLIWEKMVGKGAGSKVVVVEVARNSQILDLFGKWSQEFPDRLDMRLRKRSKG